MRVLLYRDGRSGNQVRIFAFSNIAIMGHVLITNVDTSILRSGYNHVDFLIMLV